MRYLVTILFVLVVLVGCSRTPDVSQRDPQREQRDMVLHAESDALYAKTVLTALRDGQRTNALELLEMQIDTSVIMIDHSLTNLSGPEREEALGTLRVLKAYRGTHTAAGDSHPRRRQAGRGDIEASKPKGVPNFERFEMKMMPNTALEPTPTAPFRFSPG